MLLLTLIICSFTLVISRSSYDFWRTTLGHNPGTVSTVNARHDWIRRLGPDARSTGEAPLRETHSTDLGSEDETPTGDTQSHTTVAVGNSEGYNSTVVAKGPRGPIRALVPRKEFLKVKKKFLESREGKTYI